MAFEPLDGGDPFRPGQRALALAAGADQRHLDAELLDELDVAAGGVGQSRRAVDVVERLAQPATPRRPAGVVEVALVRGEVRRLGAVWQPVAGADRELGEGGEDVEFVSASEVKPLSRAA